MENDYRVTEKVAGAYDAFAINVIKEAAKEHQNVMVSPLSVISALKMTEAGTAGKSFEELRNVLGNDASEEMDTLLDDVCRVKTKLNSANAMFLKPEYRNSVKEGFKENLEGKFGAEMFEGHGNRAVEQINSWVSRNTKGMIPGIVNDPGQLEDFMLINAVAFQDRWKKSYDSASIHENKFGFTSSKGRRETAMQLDSTEDWWLEDSRFTGFIKPYADERFSFVGLLPKNNGKPEQVLSEMTGENWNKLIVGKMRYDVDVTIPEFKYDFQTDFMEILNNLGIREIFNPETADFGRMTDIKGTHVTNVLHRTHIDVGRNGTKAAASSAVAAGYGCAFNFIERHIVVLNRPFVFAIIHTASGIPVFIGTVNTIR